MLALKKAFHLLLLLWLSGWSAAAEASCFLGSMISSCRNCLYAALFCSSSSFHAFLSGGR